MLTRAMRRAERAAASRAIAPAILDPLKGERPSLLAAANEPRPPIGAVSKILVKRFGAEVRQTSVRQFVGLAVRGILEQHGFVVGCRGVRLRGDPVFRSGAIYRPRADGGNAPEADVLERMMRSLSPDEARCAFRALLFCFPDLL